MPYNDVYNIPFPNNLIHDFKFYMNQVRPCPEVLNYTIIKHLLNYTNPRRRKAIMYRYMHHAPYYEVAKLFERENRSSALEAVHRLQDAGIETRDLNIKETISAGAASGLVMGAFRDMIYRYRCEQIAVSTNRPTVVDLAIPKKYLNILRASGITHIEDVERIFSTKEINPFDYIDNMSTKMYHEVKTALGRFRSSRYNRNAINKVRNDPEFIIELDKTLRTNGTNHNRNQSTTDDNRPYA